MKNLQSKKVQKYQKIIEAAQKVFSERGFHKATMDEIAECAQVAKGTLYLYFPDKRSLFENIINDLFNEYKLAYDNIINMEDVIQAIKIYIETRLKVYSENAKLVRIHLLSDIVEEETKHAVLNMHKYHLEMAQKIIAKGVDRELFILDDVFSAAIAINGMINQFALYHIISDTAINKETITASVMEIFLNGVKNKV